MEEVITDEEEKTATVVVPDYQLSLAIGKEGQNVRLAARICGWKIDIKSHSQYFGDGEAEYTEDAEYREYQEPEEDGRGYEAEEEEIIIFDDEEDEIPEEEAAEEGEESAESEETDEDGGDTLEE